MKLMQVQKAECTEIYLKIKGMKRIVLWSLRIIYLLMFQFCSFGSVVLVSPSFVLKPLN